MRLFFALFEVTADDEALEPSNYKATYHNGSSNNRWTSLRLALKLLRGNTASKLFIWIFRALRKFLKSTSLAFCLKMKEILRNRSKSKLGR